MNVGTEDIRRIIMRALKKSNAVLRGTKYGEFATDVAEEIYKMVGDDMGKRDFDLAYSFPQELNPVVSQLERGLGVVMMRDDKAIEVYKWLQEQGKDKISVFIKWATDLERVQYVGKYRRSPGLIRTEWKLAFNQSAPAITRNPDGSINV